MSVGPNFEALDGLIGDRGSPIIHFMASACPCLNTDPASGAVGQPDSNCDQCFGQAYIYRKPAKGVALVEAISANRIWSQQAWVQPGDVTVSPATYFRRVGNFDKIVILVPFPVDSQVITRGQKNALSPRPSGLASNEDYLFWHSGHQRARWIEDVNGRVYEPGEYLIEGRKIIWASNGGPSIGTKYTISYEAYPEYVAWTPPTEVFDLDQSVGQMVMGRRVVMAVDPTKRKIVPPWQDDYENAPELTRDPYTQFKYAPKKGLSPSR